MKRIIYTLITVLLTGTVANGQALLLEENFSYTEGAALNANGWLVHSGEGENPVLVVSPGLEFSGYLSSGIGLAAGVNNIGEDVNKRFEPQSAVGPVYAAFLVKATASVEPGADGDNPRPYFFHFFDPDNNTAHRARVFIAPGTQVGKMKVGLSFNGNAAQTQMETELNFDETYLFVAKYEIFEGDNNDSVSLYVFPAGSDFVNEPETPTLGPIKATGTQTDIVPTGVALRQFDASQRIVVDGIRVSKTWDFAEDPSSKQQVFEDSQFFVYPNPVTGGKLAFSALAGLEKQIEIFSVTGVKVYELNTVADEIDVSRLGSGLYYVRLQGGGKTYASKVVVR